MENKFKLGLLYATKGALEAMERNKQTYNEFVDLHASGDWGNVPIEDCEANDYAVKSGGRVMSSYLCKDKTVLWVITEADRQTTTILLPQEY